VPTARRIAAIGVLALAGALVAVPAAGAKDKARTVPKQGTVTVGTVRCAAAATCALRAVPKQVKVRVAGKAVKAKVLVPGSLRPGAKAAVKLRFGSGALERLAGHSARFEARIVVRASGEQSSQTFKAMLTRPAPPAAPVTPGSSGGGAGNGGTNGEGAHSEPVTGEAPVLARPLTAVSVENVSVKWYPRASWIRYVATGEGTTASAGALAVPSETSACPAQTGSREGTELPAAGQSFPYEVDFTGAGSWYDPASGQAAITGTGSVSFRFKGHTINLTGSEPEIQINGGASQAVFRFSGSEGTLYPNQRVALLSLATSGLPTTSVAAGKTTYSYDLMRGALTPDGEKVFAGFYTAPSNNGFGCVSTSFTTP
jgi:hypothetical protein